MIVIVIMCEVDVIGSEVRGHNGLEGSESMPPVKTLQDALEDDASSVELVDYRRGIGGPPEGGRIEKLKSSFLEGGKEQCEVSIAMGKTKVARELR